ncbi:ABC transporter substrate-binding protein [Kocuria sp. JC486]|uniref:ABC transporter substrate-binding protein n=1 Tax=Kocuria soli TaxID=2485125 RepID=A0A3N3ZNL1_9MICC|nr:MULTISPECIES: MetQ/NlpA family ABC transporter substrate-binding protein [Kocuria]NHU85130.1 ABC transporter substrate-binding protein [Kocuria sp. JC486]ROZ62459.1 ABC transporter substrate-binding protein [Kocuria soli]
MRAYRVSALALTSVLGLTLAGCGGSNSNEGPYDDEVVTLGVIGSSPVDEAIVEAAAEEGITVELREFGDYSQVNPATANGDIDMARFQHIAYLADYNNSAGDDITPIVSTSIYPMGLYSNQYDSLDQIKDGDEIAIPNDSINQTRALLLLESKGLVEFTSDTTAPAETDVDTEKSKVKVTPVSAEQTVLSLDSVAASVVNNDFLERADLNPEEALAEDGVGEESSYPYVNLFTTTAENADDETLNKVAELFHSDAVLEAEAKESKDTAVSLDLPREELDQILADYQKDLQK